MQSLKIIALLMEYPNDELWEAAAEIREAVAQEVPQINAFADAFFAATLIDRQAEGASCLIGGAPPHCCCSSMSTPNRGIAARLWWI